MTRDKLYRLDSGQIVCKMTRLTKVLLWLFGRRLNRELFYPVIGRAYERGVINSHQLHHLHHDFDPTQHDGVVGLVRR